MGINRRIQLENQLKESCSIPDKKVKKSAEATRETFFDKLAQDAKNATVTSKQTWTPYNALYKPLNEVLVFRIFKHMQIYCIHHAIRKQDEKLACSIEEELTCWKNHFEKELNQECSNNIS